MKKIFYYVMIFMGGGLSFVNLAVLTGNLSGYENASWGRFVFDVLISLWFGYLAYKE